MSLTKRDWVLLTLRVAPLDRIHRVAWGASGEQALIQRVGEALADLLEGDASLPDLRDTLSARVRLSVLGFCQSVGQRAISGDFVFVESADEPRILHVAQDGTAEWVEKDFASGGGVLFAYALLRKYEELMPDGLDVQRASVLAFKTIAETIEVGSFGLGPPISVWQLTKHGISELPEDQVTSLEDTYFALRREELELFLRSTEESAPSC